MGNYTNTMVCWNVGGEVCTVPWPDNRGRSEKWQRTCGACYGNIQKANHEQRKCRAFIDAMTMIVRDGCDPADVHAAFMQIEEYVDGLPDDMLSRELYAKRYAS